jgi:hypothetical protein
MADSSTLLTKILSGLQNSPEVLAIQDYLRRSGATVPISMGDLPASVAGRFSQISPSGAFEKSIVLDRYLSARDPKQASGTLAHELTHAADIQLNTQFNESSNTQFLDAYKKLVETPKHFGTPKLDQRAASAAILAPTWAATNSDYRSTGEELPGFGIGNSILAGSSTDPSPPHVDSTMATEFMILLDLALRDLKHKGKQ